MDQNQQIQDTNDVQGFQLSNRTYNKLKFLVQIVLPAIGTLYLALSGLWGWPNTEQVVGTTAALALFLGTVLGISSRSYRANSNVVDGVMNVSFGDTGIKTYSLELHSDVEELDKKDVVRFKVNS